MMIRPPVPQVCATEAPSERATKIKIEALSFFYGRFQALKDITLSMREREIAAFIGPSVCGKSTFLRCLNRMNDYIEGTRTLGRVLLDDEDVYAPDVDVVALRRRVGLVFARPNPFPMSIFDNVAFGLRI